MFKSNHNHGFSMTFENGITISVQFGEGNYCDRRDMMKPYKSDMDAATPIIESNNAVCGVLFMYSGLVIPVVLFLYFPF